MQYKGSTLGELVHDAAEAAALAHAADAALDEAFRHGELVAEDPIHARANRPVHCIRHVLPQAHAAQHVLRGRAAEAGQYAAAAVPGPRAVSRQSLLPRGQHLSRACSSPRVIEKAMGWW